jgi:hypothetical protein
METPLDIPCTCADDCDCHVIGWVGVVYAVLILFCSAVGLGVAVYQKMYG